MRQSFTSPSPIVEVPKGWQLVPVEPTNAMHKAAWDSFENDMKPGSDWKPCNRKVWQTMLSAAPQPAATASSLNLRAVTAVASLLRENFRTISYELSLAHAEDIAKLITPAPSVSSRGVTRQDAISFLESACRNWSHVPKLSEDDLGDVASELLRFVAKRAASEGSADAE